MHTVDSMAYLPDQAKVARSSTILLYVPVQQYFAGRT